MNRIHLPGRSLIRFAVPALLALGVAASASAQVLINEFEHTGSGTDRVELLNTSPDSTFDLSSWYLENQVGVSFPLSGMLAPGDHKVFPTTGHLVTDGGLIELYDGVLLIPHDSVPYGDTGGAPLPPGVGSWGKIVKRWRVRGANRIRAAASTT